MKSSVTVECYSVLLHIITFLSCCYRNNMLA